MKSLRDYIIDETIANLQGLEGISVYGCDLAYTIFESANIDGSYTYSTYRAEQWIKKYFDELGGVIEEIKMNLGAESIPNVFERPEAFQVVLLLEGASYVVGRCETVESFWNGERVLTKTLIRKISEELRAQKQGKYGRNNGFYE